RGAMTPEVPGGSQLFAYFVLVISAGCTPAHATPTHGESCLGVADRGIFADLDDKVQLALPAKLSAGQVSATIDRQHAVLVVSIDGFPRKAYPLTGTTKLTVGRFELALRPGDANELRPLLGADRLRDQAAGRDRDHDGIPDPLDVLIGAKKTVINADA